MTKKLQPGQLGENLACEYLVKNNYKIIERNFRQPWGEIDIIAKKSDKTLVFIEVKTMTENSATGLKPEDQLSTSKLEKVKRTASLYANYYPELVNKNKGWQIDLIALTIQGTSGSTLSKSNGLTLRQGSGSTLSKSNGLTINGKSCSINYYENIA